MKKSFAGYCAVTFVIAAAAGFLAYLWPLRYAEKVLIIIKPDGMRIGVKDEIYSRFRNELHLFLITESTYDIAPAEILREHYSEHRSRPFFESLIDFMRSGPLAVSVWSGKPGAIQSVREMIGFTDPKKAAANTIRAEYGSSSQQNVIHASDSVTSAIREIDIWFR